MFSKYPLQSTAELTIILMPLVHCDKILSTSPHKNMFRPTENFKFPLKRGEITHKELKKKWLKKKPTKTKKQCGNI